MHPSPQVLTAADEDLDPSIEATLPVILRMMHAAVIDTNGRFDTAAAELNEHDEEEEEEEEEEVEEEEEEEEAEEEEEEDGDVDDVGGGRERKSRKRKQRKAIAAAKKTSIALSTHLVKAMAQLLQRFSTHAGPLRAVLAIVQQMRLVSAQESSRWSSAREGASFEKMLSELEDVTTKYADDL